MPNTSRSFTKPNGYIFRRIRHSGAMKTLSILAKRQRLEVSVNVKYIAVTSRASKLKVSKVRELRDLNPRLPCESLNIGKLTHTGGVGSNPGVPEL